MNPFLVFSPFRNSVMFNNELMADVHFVVGQHGRTQRLPGHRVRISTTNSNITLTEEMNNQALSRLCAVRVIS